jgi:hypothetical protein
MTNHPLPTRRYGWRCSIVVSFCSAPVYHVPNRWVHDLFGPPLFVRGTDSWQGGESLRSFLA